jgi:hypothetical protein
MREAIGYEEPISYQEWLNIRDDYKAAWLYVQFFDQISLAWYKVSLNNIHADPDNGVSEMLSYCVKNVKKIIEDGKRFTPNYMYKVAYNCLYCIAIDRVGYKMTYESCVSQYISSGDGTELDIFDTVADDENPLEEISRSDLWNIIRQQDADLQNVIEDAINGRRITKANKARLQKVFAGYATVC